MSRPARSPLERGSVDVTCCERVLKSALSRTTIYPGGRRGGYIPVAVFVVCVTFSV